MEITPLTIYLWQISDNVCTASMFATGLLVFVSFIVWLVSTDMRGDMEKLLQRAAKIGGIAAVLFAITATFTPSSKTIAMMYVIPKLADSEVIKKDVPEMYEMAKEALREYVGKK